MARRKTGVIAVDAGIYEYGIPKRDEETVRGRAGPLKTTSRAATQELLHGPLDGKVAQVRVVLADADEEDGHVCGVDEADEGADHVADSVAL